jgi:hypothetical protein
LIDLFERYDYSLNHTAKSQLSTGFFCKKLMLLVPWQVKSRILAPNLAINSLGDQLTAARVLKHFSRCFFSLTLLVMDA